MMNNVTIIDARGNAIVADGISHIKMLENNKNYVFYTLNEIVEQNLTKMYVAESAAGIGLATNIPDNEWDKLRKIMIKITQEDNISEIQYLPLTGETFYIGEAKKLAIKADKKQKFIDKQNSAMLAVNQTPTTVQSENTFFDNSVTNEEPAYVPSSETVNAFNTPAPSDNVAGIQQLEPTPSVLETVSAPVASEQVVISQPSVVEPVTTFTPEPMEQEETIQSSISNKSISEEEAIQALKTLNEYFGLTKTLPSDLAAKVNDVVPDLVTPPAASEGVYTQQVPQVEQSAVMNPQVNTVPSYTADVTPVVDSIPTVEPPVTYEDQYISQSPVPEVVEPVVNYNNQYPQGTAVATETSAPIAEPMMEYQQPEAQVPQTPGVIPEAPAYDYMPNSAPVEPESSGYVAYSGQTPHQEQTIPDVAPVVLPDWSNQEQVASMQPGVIVGPNDLSASQDQQLVYKAS